MERVHLAAPASALVNEKVARLGALFPEAVTDGRVDFDRLRQLLDGCLDESDEKYGLNWHGRRRALDHARRPSACTLRPCPKESLAWDETQNVLIEGDNLEALKLLRKSYASSVKLIYIDPPYNTGNDFVYKDNFRESLASYQKQTGARGEDGQLTEAAHDSSGRLHTNWLNMMYPRLWLARDLLRDDGLIMISIGQEELANLLSLCQSVFGEENYSGIFVWEKKKKPSFLSHNMGSVTDFILCFSKHRPSSPALVSGSVEDGKRYPINNAGNGVQVLSFPAGSVRFNMPDQVVQPQDMSEGKIVTELLDSVSIQKGRNAEPFRLKGEWRYSQSTLDRIIANGEEILVSRVPFRPNHVKRSGDAKKTANLLSYRINGVPTNEDATNELRSLLGGGYFQYPKPVGLLTYLIQSATAPGDLILDFFAGSGTTGHAVFMQNVQDLANRRFMLVQLPEPMPGGEQVIDENGKGAALKCRTISCLARARLLRASESLAAKAESSAEDLLAYASKDESQPSPDLGFKVFKLDKSNVRAWDGEAQDLVAQLDSQVQRLLEGRTEQDVLYELMLKFGLDLCAAIRTRCIAGKTLYSVGDGQLLACLAPQIDQDEVEPLAQEILALCSEKQPECGTQVIFLDSAFSDNSAKMNMAGILEQNGIKTVRIL